MKTIGDELDVRQLAAAELFVLRDGIGRSVTCCAGAIWITQQGDARDIVLAAGERFVLDRPGMALIATADGARPALFRVR